MEHYIIYLIIVQKKKKKGKENRRENKCIQEKSIEKEKKTSFTSMHPFSSLYFQIIQNP